MEFPMPTFIAFSGNRGDHIHVEGDLASAVDAIVPTARVSGMIRLTEIAGEGHQVEPTTVYVTPSGLPTFARPSRARIAPKGSSVYIRSAMEGGERRLSLNRNEARLSSL